MKRRDALLGIPAFFAALFVWRKASPKVIDVAPMHNGGNVTAITVGHQPLGLDLHNPEDLRAFKEFVSILSNGRDIKLTISDGSA